MHETPRAFSSACFSSPLTDLQISQVFREADIQALKEAMQLTRQEAIQALKHTAGNVSKAFINELSAFDLRLDIVDDLVRNYAAQRQASCPANIHMSLEERQWLLATALQVMCCKVSARGNHSSNAPCFHPVAGR